MAGTKTKQADQTIAESQASSDIPSEPKTNRRELLKLAGAAAAGAAGGLALSSVPAAAATGSPMVLGVLNDENTTTDVVTTTGAALNIMFRAKSSTATQSSLRNGAIVSLGNPGQEASMTIPTRRKGSTRNSSIRSSSRKKEFADLVKADAVKWERIMREFGLKME